MSKWIVLGLFLLNKPMPAFAATSLADSPILAVSAGIPGNVALVLSVEYPTALGSAYKTSYDITQEYLGYFDANKCYSYLASTGSDGSYFIAQASATGHDCSAVSAGRWSGNFLNWALTQTIDPFRAALTGGYRAVDKVGLTVLEKAWAIGPAAAENPTLTDTPTITKSTPFSLSTLKIRINGLGNKFYFTSTGDNYNPGTVQADSTVTATPTANKVYQMSARVQACKTGILESNCSMYQNGDYKPTGLIQQNSLKLNFAAFGYLYDNTSSPQRDGGVLRAKMAPLGPIKSSGSTTVTNANAEWDSTTGIFAQNPDSLDATTSGVSNSGVINYLNKFGLTAPGYKTYDPVSELYYTASRYFRNKGNVPAYTSGTNSSMVDGFPVITTWDDPIKYSCQSNFIIGIGDTNTWADANLPGSVKRSSLEPTLPTEVSNDNSTVYGSVDTTTNTDNLTDVKKSTDQIGAMEGLGNLGQQNIPWCCTGSTFYMAGIAYDIHTSDIRPDFTGSQTVTTYWLDVLESGDQKNTSTGMRNQFWLTAKYGGFTVPSGFTPYSASALTKSQWDTDVNGTTNDDPDNYFRANNPALMKSGLTNAFSSIVNAVNGSSSAFSTSSPSIQSGSLTYSASYSSAGWTGDVIARQVSIDNNGISSVSNPIWNAAPRLESTTAGTGWDSNRIIATASTQASGCATTSNTVAPVTATMLQNGCGTPFRLGNLSATQKTALTSVAANQQSLLNFLRGDRSNAGSLGTKLYRDRATILGDIVNSKVVAVGPPSMPYIDVFNPGYSSFKTTYSGRSTVVYAGANDGMLHAFDGTSAVTGGNELFAYVPNALFQGPNSTPAVDGLAQLASTAYVHHYYVDATPMVTDVNFGGGLGDWHTLLVGGLGKGGKSYYAIDVTNPASLNSESSLAAKVQWEFSHPLMGYTYDTPLIVKTAKYGWVVVLTSGYNNADGRGYIFIVNPKTGALLENPIAAGTTGSLANDAGLAHVNAFVADARSGLADALYAGDLLGNLWRVDLTGTTGTYSALKIATLADASGTAQPVTTSPVIEVDNSTGKRYVFVGTGKLLSSADLTNTQTQTFYAINDGTISSFYTSATLPAAAGGFPITRSDLVNDTSTIITGITANSATPMGYYIDLGTNPANGKTNFINTEMSSSSGVIAFFANSVDSTNTCNPVGRNLLYELSYGTGKSVLTDLSGNFIANISGTGLGTNINFVSSIYYDSLGNQQSRLGTVVCDDQGNCKWVEPKLSSTKPFTQLNWRELPTAD